MPKGLRIRDEEAPQKNSLQTLAKLHADSRDFLERDQQAAIAALKARALRYETVIDRISQGVCFFDGQQRLILGNRRYAEIYGLKIDDLPPGISLREISERRASIGTCPMAVEDYFAWSDRVNSSPEAKNLTIELRDGRTIHIFHQPMPDGRWVATHEDITDPKTKRAMANERILLQTVIDWVPEYLLVDQPASSDEISANLYRIRAAIAEPVTLEGRSLYVTCSMEVATFPQDGPDPDVLLMKADIAMYKAKDSGRDSVQLNTAEMNARVHQKLALQQEIRDGLAYSEFTLLFQPQVALRTDCIFSVEALVRWR